MISALAFLCFFALSAAKIQVSDSGKVERRSIQVLQSQCLHDRMLIYVPKSTPIQRTGCSRKSDFENSTHFIYSFSFYNCSEVKMENSRLGALFYVWLPENSKSGSIDLLAHCLVASPEVEHLSSSATATNIELFSSILSDNPNYGYPLPIDPAQDLFLEIKDHSVVGLSSPDPLIVPLHCWIGTDPFDFEPTNRSLVFIDDTCETLEGVSRWIPDGVDLGYRIQVPLGRVVGDWKLGHKAMHIRCKYFRCSNHQHEEFPKCPSPFYCGERTTNLRDTIKPEHIQTATTDGLMYLKDLPAESTEVYIPQPPRPPAPVDCALKCADISGEQVSLVHGHYRNHLPWMHAMGLSLSSFCVGVLLVLVIWYTNNKCNHKPQQLTSEHEPMMEGKIRGRMSSLTSRLSALTRRSSVDTAESGVVDC